MARCPLLARREVDAQTRRRDSPFPRTGCNLDCERDATTEAMENAAPFKAGLKTRLYGVL